MSDEITWREEITREMKRRGDDWKHMVYLTASANPNNDDPLEDDTPPSIDRTFDSGYGGTRGDHVTVWTTRFVYFPVCYDGAEWVGSVHRDPVQVANAHVGGG